MRPKLAIPPHTATHSSRCFIPAALLLLLAIPAVYGQIGAVDDEPIAVLDTQPLRMELPAAAPGAHYGLLVFAPPLVAIVFALVGRQVIPALFMGLFVAAWMLAAAPTYAGGGSTLLAAVRLATEEFLIGALTDPDRAKIIVFTLTIGGLVGIIAANGGTTALVARVVRHARRRRDGQVLGWFSGLIIFFDDYANSMIIGPTLRPLCDRLGISREKLAYLVDSTAAPVASIALVGTWIGVEVGYIYDGLAAVTVRPPFLADATLDRGLAYSIFIDSIPYRFYPLLALAFVFLVGWLGRDFGPMLAAEQRASYAARGAADGTLPGVDDAATIPVLHVRSRAPEPTVGVPPVRMWLAILPILLLIALTLGLLFATGWAALDEGERALTGVAWVRAIVTNGDSVNAILYGALAAALLAVLLSLVTGALALSTTIDAATASMARMLPTICVLVLAWSLSAAVQQLELGQVAREALQAASFDVRALPAVVFMTAALVSFATGTSWGTLGILCPTAITTAAGLLNDVSPAEALPLFHATIGAVLAGAVFGDHCSPISDTTVLSSLASECRLEAHVWTQMPYALVVAGVALVCGEGLRWAGLASPWIGLLAGLVVLVVWLRVFGRPVAGGD